MEIAIISGKGGTGKTCISSAFATLSKNIVLADCDVDAANLYLIFNPENYHTEKFIGGQKAIINYAVCSNCGYCMQFCNFDAIYYYNFCIGIDPILCEGCKLCARICTENAIKIINEDKSRLMAGKIRSGHMVYGRLAPGEENSGKLVNLVREKASEIASENKIENILIDGPPGIGCPVISAVTGVDKIVIVTEPTMSGLSDLKRTVQSLESFDFQRFVIINKFDINTDICKKIEKYCDDKNIKCAGKIKYDKKMTEAMVNCKSIIEYEPNAEISKQIKEAYKTITK
jgi:MinD superfamily P-loop ATPase